MNEAGTIEACLNSLLDLDYRAYEILIVDGGSTDGTAEMVEKIAETNDRVRLIRKNGYLSAARNAGAKVAKGEILAFTDGDCFVTNNWLKQLVNPLLDEPSTTAGVGGPNIPIDKIQNLWSTVLNSVLHTFLGSAGSVQVNFTKNKHVRSVSGSNSAFWSGKVRELGGFDPRLGSCEDADLCARMLKERLKLLFVREAIVYHVREYHSLGNFGYHMYSYGHGRGEAISMKPRTDINPTAAAIFAFIALEITLLIEALLGRGSAEVLLIVSTAFYFVLVMSTSLVIGRGITFNALAAIVGFLVLHASYTTGLLTGLLSGVAKTIWTRQPA
jgi:glycosyltransferase involved in cell wall biosynthesis